MPDETTSKPEPACDCDSPSPDTVEVSICSVGPDPALVREARAALLELAELIAAINSAGGTIPEPGRDCDSPNAKYPNLPPLTGFYFANGIEVDGKPYWGRFVHLVQLSPWPVAIVHYIYPGYEFGKLDRPVVLTEGEVSELHFGPHILIPPAPKKAT